ncbi:disease resistance protein RPM1-like [Cornus florida]|uniref:disease resistance protein RPM1-like n=1 Tax=Cornus florida TaxID=4283 RepID=UPI002899DD71|nr:disease resistance protein RPM1-like [Cornus florida]XP_059631966.1 disease resistance protein RPM1-like [Cornus florida]
MASAAVELLIGKIVSVIENEASLIEGVHDELNDLKNELHWMSSFLQDTNKKRAMTEVEKSWAEDVRGMTYRVENVIDEYMYHLNQQQGRGKLKRIFDDTIGIPKNLGVKRQIATELQNIKRMMKEIPERKQRYSVVDPTEETSSHDDQKWMQNQAESALFFKDEDLVGIEADRQKLVRWLTDGEPQRTVISVVGMGGSGKSTLVANAYNHGNVKRIFHCYAWITVSQTYDIEDLLGRMIKEFFNTSQEAVPEDLSNMEYKHLVEHLSKYLQPRKYVVVLDDVWDGDVWKFIKYSLPDEGLGSRVLVTTRREDIASSFSEVKSYVHHLKPLRMTDAWHLFCMKAFSSNPNNNCPQGLDNLARGLVKKCDGLPLAIVALGGVMFSKKLEWEWKQAYDGLNNSMLSNNTELERVKNILQLSFNDLSYRLKCCFLYCSLFPEDYLIKRKRLIRLWMAEGFIEKVKKTTPEDVSENYLMSLINRSLLQVVERNPTGRPRRFKMHDLMRELAISVSEKEKFCTVLHDGSTSTDDSDKEENGVRRLSIKQGDRELLKSWKCMSHLRSLFVFVVNAISPSLSTTLPSGLRLLRVLDLEDAPIVKLPDELVHLYNLRYLNLRRTKVKELPKSIGRLHNLQTLDLRDSEIEVLPSEITKLQNLRHLIMFRYNSERSWDFDLLYETPSPSNICKLKNLQVLYLEAGMLKEARNMAQLTTLVITKVRKTDEENLCILVENMKLLRSLFVRVIEEEEHLRMDALSSAPPRLSRLVLFGKLKKVPHWIHSLQNLTFLCLLWSRLREDPLPYIQALPNLGKLVLHNAYMGTHLCFDTGFHKLKFLFLVYLPQLSEITIEKGVMPGLQHLTLRACEGLKMLPYGVEYLMHLQELILEIVLRELIDRIRGEESVDRPKVRHIPVIKHIFQSQNKRFYEILS